jgi:hypothetical protein
VVLVPLAALVLALVVGFRSSQWLIPWLLVTASSVLVVVLLAVRPDSVTTRARVLPRVAAAGLIALGLVSGVQWTQASPRDWAIDRLQAETAQWGAPSGGLMLVRPDDAPAVQRPARTPLPARAGLDSALAVAWNSVFYTGQLSVPGYVNLSGAPAFEAVRESIIGAGADFDNARAFWAAAGIVVTTPSGVAPEASMVQSCVLTGECGPGLHSWPIAYSPGYWQYDVSADQLMTVGMNESYYPGFKITACPVDEGGGAPGCIALDSRMAQGGFVTFDVPAGEWTVTAQYVTPGMGVAWGAFWAGVCMLVAWAGAHAVLAFRRRRRLRTELVEVPPA